MSVQKKDFDDELPEGIGVWREGPRRSFTMEELAEIYGISPDEQLAGVVGGFSEEEFEGFDEALECWRRVEGGVHYPGEDLPMDTKQAVVTYPADIPQILRLSDSEFARELRFLAAAKLYEVGHLTAGKAASLAGMDRISFLYELDRVGVPAINLRGEEIEAEIQAARKLAG